MKERQKKRYYRNLAIILFIIIAGIMALIYEYINDLNEPYEIEGLNAHEWQRYMNTDEFLKLEKGMTYEEVVRIAGGRGEKVSHGVYLWKDEQLLTRTYKLEFNDKGLIFAEIIE